VTGKHRAVLGALRDAQHAHEGEPVSAGQIAALCSGPWHRRSDLVTQALWLLHTHGLVLPSAGAAGGWKITATGRAELPPRAAVPPAAAPASAAHTADPRARADRRDRIVWTRPPQEEQPLSAELHAFGRSAPFRNGASQTGA
jgi:hypothetical protein